MSASFAAALFNFPGQFGSLGQWQSSSLHANGSTHIFPKIVSNDINIAGGIRATTKILKDKGNCNFEINYPKMKATIYLSYKPVQNNINSLLKDAQKLTYEHVIKADDILPKLFVNKKDKVYGMFYEVNGNAATNAQFYVTDSTKHFIDCSVYFYAKPNFDSIMPAVSYIKNDMQNLMESLRWKK